MFVELDRGGVYTDGTGLEFLQVRDDAGEHYEDEGHALHDGNHRQFRSNDRCPGQVRLVFQDRSAVYGSSVNPDIVRNVNFGNTLSPFITGLDGPSQAR